MGNKASRLPSFSTKHDKGTVLDESGGCTISASLNASCQRQDHDGMLAINIFKKHEGMELRNSTLLQHLDDIQKETDKIPGRSVAESFRRSKEMMSLKFPESALEITALPYHDQLEHVMFWIKYNEKIQSNPDFLALLRHKQQLYKAFEDPSLKGHFNEESTQWRNFLLQAAFGDDRDPAMNVQQFENMQLLIRSLVQDGMRLAFLYGLDNVAACNCSPPGENGCTKVYEGGKEYSISEIEEHFLTRNTTHLTDFGDDVVTIAISYKHYWRDKDRRIDPADLEAIAAFIKASHRTPVRFWIDTKLPRTEDGSFERWLVRGVRPYARYMTLICPSADASTERFWIANEKCIASAGKGIFYFEGDGIFFAKRRSDIQVLERYMLKVLVGETGLPPGVRAEEEGKASQWALSFLGSEQNYNYCDMTGPKVDELFASDYNETLAIRKIEGVVRRYGSVSLPCVGGRTWNKQNILLKGELSNQENKVVEWLGLASHGDRRFVYFVHVASLRDLQKERCVALRVKLENPYDYRGDNNIEEKLLGEFSTTELLNLRLVTVPDVCKWSAFSPNELMK